jgi:hypothetical protein
MSEGNVQREPWVEVLKGLPAEQTGKFVNSFLGMIEVAIRDAIPPALDNALLKLGYTEEIAGMVQLLAARSNDAKEEVLRKALTLYSLALDARDRGNRLSILNSDDVIVHEVIGFEPVESDMQPAAG